MEGHQTAHQNFLRVQPGVSETVNLVREVGSFYAALYEGVEAEFKLVQDRDFNAKYAPPVAGYQWASQQRRPAGKRGAGSGESGGNGGVSGDGVSAAAATFGRTKIVAWHEGLNFAKLKVVMPVLVQCLDTMQEFCAGPNLQNQLTLVRAGVCATLPKLFAFFGALQLRQDAPPLGKKKPPGEAGDFASASRRGLTRMASIGMKGSSGGAGGSPRESAALQSFKRTWQAASADLWLTALADTALVGRGDLTASHAYSLSFGKGHAPGAKWVGNDPALLFMLFRQRMHAEKKLKARLLGSGQGGGALEATYPDDGPTLVSLLGTLKVDHRAAAAAAALGGAGPGGLKGLLQDLRGSVGAGFGGSGDDATDGGEAPAEIAGGGHDLHEDGGAFDTSRREGGWVGAKRAFVAANAGKAAEKWRPQQGDKKGAWRFERSLRRPPRNVYSDIEDLTSLSFAMESALVTFVQSLVEGGDVGSEVVDHVAQNWDQSVMFGNAANWLGVMQEFSRAFEGAAPMHASRNRVAEVHTMAVQWHILIESMGDTNALGAAFKSDYRELCALRRLSLSRKGLPLVGRVEVVGKNDQVALLYFPVPPIVTSCWWRPEVKHKRNLILYPDNLGKRSNPDEKLKDFLEQADGLVEILEHEFMLQELATQGGLQRCAAELGRQSATLSFVALGLTLLLNALLLSRVGYSDDGRNVQGTREISYSSLPLWHFVTSCLLLASYTISTGWRNVRAAHAKNQGGVVTLYSRQRWLVKLVKLLASFCAPRAKGVDLLSAGGGMGVVGGSDPALSEKGDDHGATFVLPPLLLVPWRFVSSDWRAAYYTCFAAVSLVGFAVTPLAFVACMFDVVRMSPTMQKVIRSLTYNVDQVRLY